MGKAIKDHARDFLAIIGLIVGRAWSRPGSSSRTQRLRIPVLEERPFQLKAELETAQAVTPGQGQTVRVAGVRVGDISKVEYDDGIAVVTMDIDQKFLPVYQDATILLRPKTGLKDMFLELDPGTQAAGEYEEDDTIPVANTAPDVNLDEVLDALDTDTRAYLQSAAGRAAARASSGRGKDLGELLGSLGPINRDLARLNREVAKRKENLANLIHNMNILFGRVGQEDEEIAALIDASNAALGAIAEPGPRRTARDRPAGPDPARDPGRADRDQRARRGARAGAPRPAAVRPQAEADQRVARPPRARAPPATSRTGSGRSSAPRASPVRDLRPAAPNLAEATPGLTTVAEQAQQALQHGRLQPERGGGRPARPSRDEGYLYWLGWLGHVGNSTFQPRTRTASTAALPDRSPATRPRASCRPARSPPVITGLGPIFAAGAPCGP